MHNRYNTESCTPQDIIAFAELQASLDRLPPLTRMYYLLKARYRVKRKLIRIALGGLVVGLGILSWLTRQNPAIVITAVVVGIVIGLALVWESEYRNKDG